MLVDDAGNEENACIDRVQLRFMFIFQDEIKVASHEAYQ